jgi:ABC-type enterochelin transport system ATPase subunit
MNIFKIGDKVKVKPEYRENEEQRMQNAIVIGHEFNQDYNYMDNIIQFSNGSVMQFGDHEIEFISNEFTDWCDSFKD